jgi:hypothetical protein
MIRMKSPTEYKENKKKLKKETKNERNQTLAVFSFAIKSFESKIPICFLLKLK